MGAGVGGSRADPPGRGVTGVSTAARRRGGFDRSAAGAGVLRGLCADPGGLPAHNHRSPDGDRPASWGFARDGGAFL